MQGDLLRQNTSMEPQPNLEAASADGMTTTSYYPPQDPGDGFWKTRLGKVMDKAEPFIVALIIINAIMMGVGTFDFVTDNPEVEKIFEEVDRAFLIVFTIELVLNLIDYFNLDRLQLTHEGVKVIFESELAKQLDEYERKKNQGWVAFDAIIVLTSWAFSDLSVFRGFRILRALRLVTKFTMFRNLVGALINVSSKVRTRRGEIVCLN